MIAIEGNGPRRLERRAERRRLDVHEVNARTLILSEEKGARTGIGGISGASRTVAGTASGDGERKQPRAGVSDEGWHLSSTERLEGETEGTLEIGAGDIRRSQGVGELALGIE